jgi:hypothetical protein
MVNGVGRWCQSRLRGSECLMGVSLEAVARAF